MALQAAALELLVLAVAGLVLLWDLASPGGRARGNGPFVLASAGLLALFVASFFIPAPAFLTDAFVLDGFALYVKRILLATALLAVLGLRPSLRARGAGGRGAEAIVRLLLPPIGGMALVAARALLTRYG